MARIWEIVELAGVFNQPVDVQEQRLRAREFKGVRGFAIAVGAGGAEDKSARRHVGIGGRQGAEGKRQEGQDGARGKRYVRSGCCIVSGR